MLRLRLSAPAVLASLLLLSGCASAPPQAPAVAPARSRASRAPSAADLERQRRLFEQGEDFFAEERYDEARRAWLDAARVAPSTLLAARARRQLKRVDAVLRNLKELEAQ